MPSFVERLLWLRAKDYLATYKPDIIGIAGSSNLPVVKEAARLLLRRERQVYAPVQPKTDPYGVALAILGLESLGEKTGWFKLLSQSFIRELVEREADTLILELAAERPGDMDWLAMRLPVNIAIITNVQSQATDLFGAKEFVAHEIASLVASLSKDSLVILNADDPLVMDMTRLTRARVVTFGTSAPADIKIGRVDRLAAGGFVAEIVVGGQHYAINQKNLLSRSQLEACFAALALACALGINLETAISRLKDVLPPKGFLSLATGASGAVILDDSGNSTPENVLEALQTLRALPAQRKIAVLGDVTRLGSESVNMHRAIGSQTGQIANVAIFIGDFMRQAGREALKAGCDVHHFDSAADAGKWLADFAHHGDLVLVAGGRDMQMGEAVSRLGSA